MPAYDGGVDEGTFLARMRVVLTDTSGLIPFQTLRAELWLAIALPVVRVMNKRRSETAQMVGCLVGGLLTPRHRSANIR